MTSTSPELQLEPIPRIRTSERKVFKECQQRWQWSYQNLYTPKHTSSPLWFGTGAHVAWAEWYCGPGTKRGRHPAETWAEYAGDSIHFAKVERAMSERVESEMVDMKALGEVLFQEYVKHYGTDPHISVIAPEKTFELDIPWPKDHPLLKVLRHNRPWLAHYNGTYDLVYRDLTEDALYLLENKTAANISKGHLSLDDQGGTYWTMAYRTLLSQGLIAEGDRLQGIEYNFMRKALPDERPKDSKGYRCNKPIKQHYIDALTGMVGWDEANLKKLSVAEMQSIASANDLVVLGERSKIQPKPLFERHRIHRSKKEMVTQLNRIQDEAMQMELVRQGLVGPSKNSTYRCERFCEFFEMCELHERRSDWQQFASLSFTTRDPYEDHSGKSAENE